MKKITLLVFTTLLLLSACAQSKNIKEAGSKQFHQLIAADKGILLDVRTKSEFNNGHIAKAGN